MSRDYERKIGDYFSSGKSGGTFGRFRDVRLVNGTINYVDSLTRNEIDLQESKSIIVDNSGYTPDYLNKCYGIEFYLILKHVQDKLQQAAQNAKK